MKVKQRETIRDELCELRRLESLWEEADAVANARAKEVLVLLGELRESSQATSHERRRG